MAKYYIDLENTRQAAFDGCSRLTKADTIFVFYTKNANTMDIDVLRALAKTKSKINYIRVPLHQNNAAKNGLDFALVTTVFSSPSNKNNLCFIISEDRGYEYAIQRGRELGFKNINLCENIKKALEFQNDEVILSQKPEIEKALEARLTQGEAKKHEKYIINSLKKVSGPRAKHEFYNSIVRRMGMQKGLALYNKLKDDFAELKSLV